MERIASISSRRSSASTSVCCSLDKPSSVQVGSNICISNRTMALTGSFFLRLTRWETAESRVNCDLFAGRNIKENSSDRKKERKERMLKRIRFSPKVGNPCKRARPNWICSSWMGDGAWNSFLRGTKTSDFRRLTPIILSSNCFLTGLGSLHWFETSSCFCGSNRQEFLYMAKQMFFRFKYLNFSFTFV